jgi:hypothetical protein
MHDTMTKEEAVPFMVGIINKLVNNHLKLEKKPMTFEERVDFLHDAQPDFNLAEAKLMLCVAIAMLVEEREKKKANEPTP